MRKIKNGILELLVCVIIFASFKMPEILFKMENDRIQSVVYEKARNKATMIDVEAEEIYLVKAIHDIENTSNIVEIASSNKTERKVLLVEETENTRALQKEIVKLKEYHILKDIEAEEMDCILMNNSYQNENRQYEINTFFWEGSYKLECKTGKILEITIAKDKIADSTKEEIMRNYVQYLDLYIIDDWKFENNMLKSEKAQLFVSFVVSQKSQLNSAILAIHSMESIFQIVEPATSPR